MIKPYIRSAFRRDPLSWSTEQYFSLDNFCGGLNNVEPDNVIADNECTDCMNMRFVNDNIMEKRRGVRDYLYINPYQAKISLQPIDEEEEEENEEDNDDDIVLYYNTLTDADKEITYLDVYNPSLSVPLIVRATSSKVYIGDEMIQEVQGDISGVTYSGKYYFVDGHNLYCYDNEDCYRIIPEPIEHTVEDSSSGSTTLVFDEDGFSEIVAVGTSVRILAASLNTTANLDTTVTAKTISEGKVTITIANALTGTLISTSPVFFYLPADSTHTVGTEVWDDTNHIAYYLPCTLEIADSYAGESYFPDSPNIIVVHQSRLVIAGDSEQPHGVYMSRTAQPLYFPSGASFSVTPDGNKVIDLVVFDNALIIGRNLDMFVLYGTSEYQTTASDPYYIKQMDVSCGFISKDCGALLNNYYIYLGYDGRFYKLNTPTTYVEYLMTSPIKHKCDVFSSPINISRSDTIIVNAVAYRNEIYFNISGELTVVYSYDNMAFTYFKGWDESRLKVFDNNLLIGTHHGKLLYYCDDESIYNDDGVAISCKYHTKRFDFNNPISFKYFKKFMITSHAWTSIYSYITTSFEVDLYDYNIPTPISSNMSRFNSSNWDRDVFNNRNLYKSPYYNLDIRGRTIMFKFSNSSLNESMRLYDINILYSLRDVR